MFVVSNRAINEIAEADRRIYIQQLSEFLRARYPSAREVPREGLLAVIDKQVEKALRYGFKTEQQGAKYVLTAWLCGIDFDTRFLQAKKILTGDVDPEIRATQLEYWCRGLFENLQQRTLDRN